MKITMYYDAHCPVCRTEALHMADKKPDNIHIIPIHQAVDELAQFGISEVDAMTYLCVKDDNDQLHKGMDAVRLLHQVAETGVAKWLDLPLIKQASDWVYPIFARNRYRIPNWVTKLAYGELIEDTTCENGVCSLPPQQRLNSYQDKNLAK